METSYAGIEEVSQALEGAVIEGMEQGEGGIHLRFRDGRVLLLVDALVVALITGNRTLQ